MSRWLLACVLAFAALTSAAADGNEAKVRAAVQKKFPQLTVESVAKTPVPGIYEVFASGQLAYVDENVNFLFVNANLIDVDKSRNLTEERMNRLTAIKFEELPLDLAIKKVKGKGTRKFAYFGDPNCGYCKRFEQSLAQLNDVTIYVFLLPVLGPDSVEKSKSVWCSKDRVKAWDDLLLNGVAPTAPGTCPNPIDKLMAYGKQKNITGTPTLFFTDGQRVPGAIPKEMLEKYLAAASPR